MLWFRIAKSQNHPITNHLESPLMSPEERAKKIKVLVFDVDGVLTDGKIWLFPAPAGAELKTQQQAQPKADAGGGAVGGPPPVGSKGFFAPPGGAVVVGCLGGGVTRHVGYGAFRASCLSA